MKKLLITSAVALMAFIASAQDNSTNSVPPPDPSTNTVAPPALTVIQVTNVSVAVQPLILTEAQMAGVIQAVQYAGVSANVPITTTNLYSVHVQYRDDGSGIPSYLVTFKLK